MLGEAAAKKRKSGLLMVVVSVSELAKAGFRVLRGVPFLM